MTRDRNFRPFAYGYSGRLLTSTEANEVFCCDGNDEAPYFIHAMDGTVTGVRNIADGVLATDDTGALILLAVPEGKVAWRTELGVTPVALAATESGRWAAVHERGVIYGRGPEQAGTIDLPDATGAVFRDDDTLAVVSEGGRLEICDLRGGHQTTVEIGEACNSVAWSALGWWLVGCDAAVHRVEADGSTTLRYLKWNPGSLSSVCASKAGGLCAFVTNEKYVVIFGVVRDINCGTVIYHDRVAYEAEFGPDTMLGIGIGMGDGNKIDLRSDGAVSRTDPPPDRPRNRWILQAGYDPAEIEEALKLERAYQAGQIRFEGAELIMTAAPNKPPATAEPSASTPATRPGGSSAWVLVVGILAAVVAALLWGLK